jgi:hypothetical protein
VDLAHLRGASVLRLNGLDAALNPHIGISHDGEDPD